MTTNLIGFDSCNYESTLRQKFLDRFNATPKEQQKSIKESLQNEFKLALVQLDVDKHKRQKERFENNLKAFLEDPNGILNELNGLCGSCFTLGEILISYGIAKTTIKRQKGKGILVHKGTIAEHTMSNFLVTAKIGDETLSIEIGGSNDKNDKERSMAMVSAMLAKKIVENS